MKAGSPFSRLDHIAIIVNDMDKATKHYESFGLGPFQPVVVSLAKREVRGKPVMDVRNKASLGRVGEATIELVEPLEGKQNIYKEYRDAKGEGIQHVCFGVDDIEKETASLVAKGVKVLSIGRFSNGGGYTYFDTAAVGGIILELMQWPSGFQKPAANKNTPFARLDHMGVIVKDIDRAIKHFDAIGIGPFRRLKNLESAEKRVMGKVVEPASIQLDARMVELGSFKFELIQPLVGESLWKKFVDTHGEGSNHICFKADNVFKEAEKVTAGGVGVLYSSRFKAGGGAIYFDTQKIGGVILEIAQWPPNCLE